MDPLPPRKTRVNTPRDLWTSLALIFVCLMIFVAPALTFDEFGVVTPRDPVLFVGQTLRLDCNITNAEVRENSSFLYFQHDNSDVSSSLATVLNTRAIRLTIHSVSIGDQGSYTCLQSRFQGGQPRAIGHQKLLVDYRPREIVDEKCRVYNWVEMTCTWELGDPPYQHPDMVDVAVYWVTVLPAGSPSAADHYDCPNLTKTSCTWDKAHYSHSHTYYIRVVVNYRVKDKVMESASKQFPVNTLLHVEPAPVHHLDARSENSSCVRLLWEHDGAVHQQKIFKAQYRTPNIDGDWIDAEPNPTSYDVEDRSFYQGVVCGLDPFTQYQFRVAVEPLPTTGGEPGGYPSLWKEVMVWTQQGVPSAAPYICPACFQEVTDSDLEPKIARRVKVMWQAIPSRACHGTLSHYNVSYLGLSSGRSLSVIANGLTPEGKLMTSANLDLPSAYEDYRVKVVGATVKGESRHASYMLIPALSNKPPPPQRFLVERSSSDSRYFFLSWAALTSRSHVSSNDHTHTRARNRQTRQAPVTDLYVLWCPGDRQRRQCWGDIQSVRLPPQQVTYELRTAFLPGDPHNFLIGISSMIQGQTEGQSYSSGIQWSPCIYIHNTKPEQAPLNVRFATTTKTEEEDLTVKWDKAGCGEEASYVTEYLVKYCQTLTGKQCDGEQRTLNVSGEATMASLPDLSRGTQYLVEVIPVSSAGLGPSSDYIKHTVASRPPEEDFTSLVIIIICIVLLTVLLTCFFIVCRYCYRRRKKGPSIKGLLSRPPLQTTCPPSHNHAHHHHHHHGRPLPDPPSEESYDTRHIYGTNDHSPRVCMSNRGFDKSVLTNGLSAGDTSLTVPLIIDNTKMSPAGDDQEHNISESTQTAGMSISPNSGQTLSSQPSSDLGAGYLLCQGMSGGDSIDGTQGVMGKRQYSAEDVVDADMMFPSDSGLLAFSKGATLPMRRGVRGCPEPRDHEAVVFTARHIQSNDHPASPHRNGISSDAGVSIPSHREGNVRTVGPLDGQTNGYQPQDSCLVTSSFCRPIHSVDSNSHSHSTSLFVDQLFALHSPFTSPRHNDVSFLKNIPNHGARSSIDDGEFCTCDHNEFEPDNTNEAMDNVDMQPPSPAAYSHLVPTVTQPNQPLQPNSSSYRDHRRSIPIEAILGYPPPPPGLPSPTPPYDNAPPLPTDGPSRFAPIVRRPSRPKPPQMAPLRSSPAVDSDDYLEPQTISLTSVPDEKAVFRPIAGHTSSYSAFTPHIPSTKNKLSADDHFHNAGISSGFVPNITAIDDYETPPVCNGGSVTTNPYCHEPLSPDCVQSTDHIPNGFTDTHAQKALVGDSEKHPERESFATDLMDDINQTVPRPESPAETPRPNDLVDSPAQKMMPNRSPSPVKDIKLTNSSLKPPEQLAPSLNSTNTCIATDVPNGPSHTGYIPHRISSNVTLTETESPQASYHQLGNGLDLLTIPSSHVRPLSRDLLELPASYLVDPVLKGSNPILTEL